MNVYTPTGKKMESWPQWVARLQTENKRLRHKVMQLTVEKQNTKEMEKLNPREPGSQLSICCHASLKKQLVAQAEIEGISVSELARKLIAKGLRE